MCIIRPVAKRSNKERMGNLYRKFSFELTQALEGMEREQELIFSKLVKIDPPLLLSTCMALEDKKDGDTIEESEGVIIPDYIEYMIFEDDDVCPVCERRIVDHDFYVSLPVGISLKLKVLDVSNLDTVIRKVYKKVGIEHLFLYKF